jgi:hypothetical protein
MSKYHVVAMNSRTGRATVLTPSALTKREACTVRGKHSAVRGRRVVLVNSTTGKTTTSCSKSTKHRMSRR